MGAASGWRCSKGSIAGHRTRAIGRTVNLCFEELGAETVFVDRTA